MADFVKDPIKANDVLDKGGVSVEDPPESTSTAVQQQGAPVSDEKAADDTGARPNPTDPSKEVIEASNIPDNHVAHATNATGAADAADSKAAEDTGARPDGADSSKQVMEASDVPDYHAADAADSKVAEDGKASGDSEASEDSKAAEAKIAEEVKLDDGNGSESRMNKPKDAPVSISAHDRYEGNKRGRGGYGKNSKIKTRFDDQPESNDADDIRRQVEFYFSDSNLPIDAYLLQETGGHRNRPVPLSTIHNFKRMRHFQPYDAVRDAVKESHFLTLSDQDEITRKTPLSEKFTDDPSRNRGLVHTSSMSRSIYAKGFGREARSTHFDIENFFAPYGPTKSVRLRRHEDGEFKGSVFVEFDSEDTQRQFLELDPKPEWEGKVLEIMSKQEYVDIKHQGIIDGTVKPKRQSSQARGGRDGQRGGKREWIDKDDWKARRDRDQDDDRRSDRRDKGGPGRGKGRGSRGGCGGNRRRSPDFRHSDKKRRRDDDKEKEGERDEPPSRAEAESKKLKMDDDHATEPNGDASAGAPGADQEMEKQAKGEAPA